MTELEEWLRRRLQEAGIETSEDELRELAAAYPALQAWMRMVEELSGEQLDVQVGLPPGEGA